MTNDASFYDEFGERGYISQPVVDSGIKKITAVVTDAAGNSAEFTYQVYVILNLAGGGDLLQGGKTYRLFGELITVPQGLTLEIGGLNSAVNGEAILLHHPTFGHLISLRQGTNAEIRRLTPTTDSLQAIGHTTAALNLRLDQLVASAGRLPTATTVSP